jgi:chromosome segregation ATPase
MEHHMEDSTSILQELQAKRADLIGKLKRIDEKKSTVSVEVYEKVKKEYADKLKGIEDEFSRHIDLISEEIQRLKVQEEEIIQKKKELKLDMEEVELRYSIGEYDEGSFKKVKEEHEVGMRKFDQELGQMRETMASYSSLLTPQEPQPKPEPKPTPKPEPKPAAPVKPESELKIDEHILEEKLPEEEIALEELLSEEDAVKPEMIDESSAETKSARDKGVTCPKCGHVNTADSWYCEKCGAEILGASG